MALILCPYALFFFFFFLQQRAPANEKNALERFYYTATIAEPQGCLDDCSSGALNEAAFQRTSVHVEFLLAARVLAYGRAL